MFGGEPIVRDKGLHACSGGNLADKMTVGVSGAKVEPATVEMEDRLARPQIGGMDPNSRYAANQVCFECHVIARRDAPYEGIVLCASFASPWDDPFGGPHHGAQGGGDRTICGIERIHRDKVR